jgi:hypothetical protein
MKSNTIGGTPHDYIGKTNPMTSVYPLKSAVGMNVAQSVILSANCSAMYREFPVPEK